MQPTQLTMPGLILFVLTILIIFAFKNPNGYKKIQGILEKIITLLYGSVSGVLIYKTYLLSKLNGKIIDGSTINFLFSFEGDWLFYSATAFLLFIGVIMLEKIHKLNDKS